jgi:hypothetical protein
MEKMTLQFQGVCMNTLSIVMTKEGVEALLNYCQKNKLNLYDVLDSISSIKSVLPKETSIYYYFPDVLFYHTSSFDMYLSINNQSFDHIDTKLCSKEEVQRNIYNFNNNLCILEKSIINEGIIYYDLETNNLKQFEPYKLSFSLCRSHIDGSLLCRRIYYQGRTVAPSQVFMSPTSSLHDISVQYQGNVFSFPKLFSCRDFDAIRNNEKQGFISEILEIIH